MARSNWKMVVLPMALLVSLGTGACRVRQTEEGKLPEYDVDAPKVDVGTEKKEITVPKVDVSYPDDKKTDNKPPQN